MKKKKRKALRKVGPRVRRAVQRTKNISEKMESN